MLVHLLLTSDLFKQHTKQKNNKDKNYDKINKGLVAIGRNLTGKSYFIFLVIFITFDVYVDYLIIILFKQCYPR